MFACGCNIILLKRLNRLQGDKCYKISESSCNEEPPRILYKVGPESKPVTELEPEQGTLARNPSYPRNMNSDELCEVGHRQLSLTNVPKSHGRTGNKALQLRSQQESQPWEYDRCTWSHDRRSRSHNRQSWTHDRHHAATPFNGSHMQTPPLAMESVLL